MPRKLLTLLLLTALVAFTGTLLAQDETEIPELSETFNEGGGVIFSYPEGWDVQVTAQAIMLSDMPIEDGLSTLPADSINLIFITESMEALQLDASATGVDILELIASSVDEDGNVTTPEIETVELENYTFGSVDQSDTELAIRSYATKLTDSTFVFVAVGTNVGELEAALPIAEAILGTLDFVIEAPIAEESLTRYDEIEQSVNELGFPVLGDPDAPVIVTEIGSFDCPHCGTFHETMFPELLPRVEAGEIQFVYVPIFGTGNLSNGQGAAMASICALEQDSFWVFHDMLFGWQSFGNAAFSVDRINAGVEALELDTEAFAECMVNEDMIATLENAFTTTRELPEFTGTPTILVNSEKVDNGIGVINEAIDTALAGDE